MHIHHLNSSQHAHLLEENRRDSITGEPLKEGDSVVFCAACSSAFHLSSWEYINKRHCHQSRTLAKVPAAKTAIALKKGRYRRSNRVKRQAPNEQRLYLAASLSVALMLLSLLFYGGYQGYSYLRYRTFDAYSSYSLQTNFAFEKRLMKRGDYYLAVGKYQSAIEEYEEILDYNANYRPAQQRIESIRNGFQRALQLGDRRFARQEYNKAKVYFQEALRYDPDNPKVLDKLDQIALIQSNTPVRYLRPETREVHVFKTSFADHSAGLLSGKRWFLSPSEDFPSQLSLQKVTALDVKEGQTAWAEGGRVLVRRQADTDLIRLAFSQPVHDLSLSHDGEELAVVTAEGVVKIVDMNTRKVIKNLLGTPETQVAWLPNPNRYEKQLATTGTDHHIYIYKMHQRRNREIRDFRVIEYPESVKVILSPDGKYFATYDQSGIFRVYLTENDKLAHVFSTEKKTEVVGQPSFSQDATLLIATQKDGSAALWSLVE